MPEFHPPLPPGGIFGQQKWSGGNGIDIFTRRGTPVYAITSGVVQPYGTGPASGGLLRGDNGISAQYLHIRLTRTGRVRAGDQIGVVDDPGLDILGPYPGMPDNFQHLDLTLGHGSGPFPITGGDINAASWLQQIGYGRPSVAQTRGPGGMPGMGMPGMGMPGMGMPGMGMPPVGGMPAGGLMPPFGTGSGPTTSQSGLFGLSGISGSEDGNELASALREIAQELQGIREELQPTENVDTLEATVDQNEPQGTDVQVSDITEQFEPFRGFVVYALVVLFVAWIQQYADQVAPDAARVLVVLLIAGMAIGFAGRFGNNPFDELAAIIRRLTQAVR